MFFKPKTGVTRIVLFLGNPGEKYAKTRHNVGFMTASVLEKREKLKIARLRFNALTTTATIGGEKTLLMKPQTYMNLSGKSLLQAVNFYKVPAENVIIICDDVSLPLATLRIRTKGSAGGHNGLKSVISTLGTDDFPRIKIGVGEPARAGSEDAMVDWVLGEFKGKDRQLIDEACERAADALTTYISEGADSAMNKFN